MQAGAELSDQLEWWLAGPRPRTLGSLVDVFAEKAFAVAFVVLMAPSALPLPTGGVTNGLEVVTMLLALELIAGRRTIWLPMRWRRLDIGGPAGGRFATRLLKWIRRLERFSHPRLRALFDRRASGVVFGLFVFLLTLAAFLAPPFSGLDTLPSLGVVLIALGMLHEDFALAAAGLVAGAIGSLLLVVLGSVVVEWLHQLA